MNDDLDPKLLHLYRQLPKEQPSQAVDMAILQAAQQAMVTKTYWRPVWGIAASLVMMSSLMWYWQAKQPQELSRAVAVSASAPTSDFKKIEPVAKQQELMEDREKLLRDEAIDVAQVPHLSAKVDVKEDNAVMATDAFERKKQRLNERAMNSQLNKEKLNDNLTKQKLFDMASPEAAPANIEESREGSVSALSSSIEVDKKNLANSLGMANRGEKMITDRVEKSSRDLQKISIENAYLNMHLKEAEDQGFNCQRNMCRKILVQPIQESYFGLSTLNSELLLFLEDNVVYKISLETKSNVAENAEKIWRNLGENTTLKCPLEDQDFQYRRLWNKYIMLLSIENKMAKLMICGSDEK